MKILNKVILVGGMTACLICFFNIGASDTTLSPMEIIVVQCFMALCFCIFGAACLKYKL